MTARGSGRHQLYRRRWVHPELSVQERMGHQAVQVKTWITRSAIYRKRPSSPQERGAGLEKIARFLAERGLNLWPARMDLRERRRDPTGQRSQVKTKKFVPPAVAPRVFPPRPSRRPPSRLARYTTL